MTRQSFNTVLLILLAVGSTAAFSFLPVRPTPDPESTGAGRDVYWGLTDRNKTETCILLSGLFELAIPYPTDYFSMSKAIIPVPRNASVSGFCDWNTNPNVQIMTLTWAPDPMHPEKQHNLTFVFLRRNYEDNEFSQPYYELYTIQGTIYTNEVEFPDAANDKVYKLMASELNSLLSARVPQSYYCKSTQVIEFDDGRNSLGMTLVHAEAFNEEMVLGDGNDFGPRSFCAKDGFEVILMVLLYVIILALIGLAVFYIVDNRSKRSSYIYL